MFLSPCRFPSIEVDIDSELKKLQDFGVTIKPMVKDTVFFVNQAISGKKKVIVEGANAAMLDIDFGM